MAYTSYNNKSDYNLTKRDKADGKTEEKFQSTNNQNKTIQNPPMSFFLLKDKKIRNINIQE